MYVFCVVTRYTRSLVFVWLIENNEHKGKILFDLSVVQLSVMVLLQTVFTSACGVCVSLCKGELLSMILEIHAIQKS